jgi:hypothetical protein
MPKLNPKQIALLEHAGRQPGGAILPLPDGLDMTPPALNSTLGGLRRHKLVAKGEDNVWRITDAGRAAAPLPVDAEPAPRPKGRKGELLLMLEQPNGTTLSDMTTATGWQAHSIRAAMTGLRKSGFDICREPQTDGPSIFRVLRHAGGGA